MRGRDIKRYGYEFADLYLIVAHNGIREKGVPRIDINKYSAIKKHLDKFYSELDKRTDKGDTPYNLRNCAYMEDFYKQKIVWGEISDKTKFAIDLKGEFVAEATTFLLTGESLMYLLGFLNSKLSEYIFSQIGTTTGVGTIRWKKFTIEQLRIPKITNEQQKFYNDIVNQIVANQASGNDTIHLIKRLDKMIYNEFRFSQEEIEAIQGKALLIN